MSYNFKHDNKKNQRDLEDVFEIIHPHIHTNNPLASLNRLFRKCYFKNNIIVFGKLKAYKNLLDLPYIDKNNTQVELLKFDVKDIISFQPNPLKDDRRKPYRYDTPIIVILYNGVHYRIDGGKRLRHLHFNLKRKTIDVLLITVIEEHGKLTSLSKHLRDRVVFNLPSN